MRRRAALIGVSAVVVLGLGGTLAACAGGGERSGYVAVGAAGPGPSAPDHAVPPRDGVQLVPLDGSAAPGPSGSSGTGHGAGPGTGTGTPSAPPGPGAPAGQTPATPVVPGPAKSPAAPGRSPSAGSPGAPNAPGSPTAPSGTPSGSGGPAGPAVLTLGAPSRSAGDHRWCENVTVQFRNSGGTAVKSGSVMFATHIIGLLGVDWATIASSQPLPVPIAAGAVSSHTYGVCVEAWRVPLGMHVETRSVTASWK
ncbi:hypothetical protein [Streptomyces sp. WM6378]|uniref:hypothetical protein n=1 Tax=Streptomyces sp. WM6378 TaxID=1415557 RepID=UPI00099DC1BF|nr:hypothetical protein [Streptomyces sp. WM6378]